MDVDRSQDSSNKNEILNRQYRSLGDAAHQTAPLLAHGRPVKLPSDLYQHLRQAIEKGDSECKQLAHEKGVQRVLGHLMPN